VRVILAATCVLLVAGNAAPSGVSAGAGRTPACKTITVAEALDAMDDSSPGLFYGRGHSWPLQQFPGKRPFKGKEVSCSWASDNGLGNIDLGVFVLPTSAEATRYYRAWNPLCPKAQRVNVGAGACGAAGILRAHWGRFAIGLNGATSKDGSVIRSTALVILAKHVFFRAPRTFPTS
jgi:hypothetical protein